jgi:uncharacterized protein YcbX
MTVSAPGMADLKIQLRRIPDHDSIAAHTVRVCGDRCGGKLWGDVEVSEWFTAYLGVQCWLARFQEGGRSESQSSKSDADLCPAGRRAGFANEQAVLLISENAVSLLNHVLEEEKQRTVGPRHFRPNVVVSTMQGNTSNDDSHIEDDWNTLKLIRNGLTFETRGSCARCAMVDFDPYSGEKGKTLRALARYRRHNGQITFGVFLGACPGQEAKDAYIEEGDLLLCEYT